ncbi:hypothetical protein BDQ12DRAFT_686781 [Crucibulum laeve]|uniref:SH3 domain-containing protein n=1 Tax=Crucibulum laeve TaxID=68775 RepID=A0A5C3LWU3_9AGAR|nr:hypothetical protein BDQ12DRAFT_686781 [Crucibulum laeve]
MAPVQHDHRSSNFHSISILSLSSLAAQRPRRRWKSLEQHIESRRSRGPYSRRQKAERDDEGSDDDKGRQRTGGGDGFSLPDSVQLPPDLFITTTAIITVTQTSPAVFTSTTTTTNNRPESPSATKIPPASVSKPLAINASVTESSQSTSVSSTSEQTVLFTSSQTIGSTLSGSMLPSPTNGEDGGDSLDINPTRNGLSSGGIAGIVMGCLLLNAFMFSCFIFRKRINRRFREYITPSKSKSVATGPTISSFEPKEYRGSTSYLFRGTSNSFRSPSLNTRNSVPPIPPIPPQYTGNSARLLIVGPNERAFMVSESIRTIQSNKPPSTLTLPDDFSMLSEDIIIGPTQYDEWPRTVSIRTSTSSYDNTRIRNNVEDILELHKGVGHQSLKPLPKVPSSHMSYRSFTVSGIQKAAALFPNYANVRHAFNPKPSRADELRLTVGETVRVLAEYDDGFALCMDSHGGRGMAPLTCLDRQVWTIGNRF